MLQTVPNRAIYGISTTLLVVMPRGGADQRGMIWDWQKREGKDEGEQ